MNDDKKLKQNTSQNEHTRSVSFLIISLLLHAFLLISFYTYEVFFKSDSVATKVEIAPDIQFIDISDAHNGRLVEQSEDEKANEKPKDARFVSKVDKSVEKETRAARHGEFQNKQAKEAQAATSQQFAPPPAAPEKEVATVDDETIKTFESGDLAVPQAKEEAPKKKIARSIADLRPNTMQEMSQNSLGAISQTSDYLKDVAIGAETHLNTREFLYYSYFNRIKKKLRQHWEPLVHAKVRLMYKKGRDVASTGSKATRVVITLDEHGLLRRVQVSTTSGLEDLDDAAIEALKEAAQFPNPPKDLVREGFVTLNWDFILES